MITATLRSDASSRFAKGNRWGLFPSVALGWKISQEAFLRDSDILSDLKLRLSYGQTGQQDILNDYPYMTTFTVPMATTPTSSGRLPKLITSDWITASLITVSMVLWTIINATPRTC